MNNPFALWASMIDAGRMMSETADASNAVIASRSGTIAEAAYNPLAADHRELARMVSEKSAAFARAGQSLANDWSGLQGELFAQAQALGSMWLGGFASPRAAESIIARSQRINERAIASGIRALRPIHATATANKRRLKG